MMVNSATAGSLVATRRSMSRATAGTLGIVLLFALTLSPPASAGAAAAAKTKPKVLSLSKVGVSLRQARLDAQTIRLTGRSTQRTAKLTFEVLSSRTSSRPLARSKTVALRRATRKQRARYRALVVRLDRAPAGRQFVLRVTARVGKRTGRGFVPLRMAPAAPSSPLGPDTSLGQLPAPSPTPEPPGCDDPTADTDGDSITDCREREGFTFRYYEAGPRCVGTVGEFDCRTIIRRNVSTDPRSTNTDGDAVTLSTGEVYELTDREEWLNAEQGGFSDPTSTDSDGDGLSDVEEIKRWGTSAQTPDTDGDSAVAGGGAQTQHALYDKAELTAQGKVAITETDRRPSEQFAMRWVSSPTAADTDGDGRSDFEEWGSGVTSPRVVDLPKIEVVPKPQTAMSIQVLKNTSQSFTLSNQQTSEANTGRTAKQMAQYVSQHKLEVGVEVSSEVSVKAAVAPEAEAKLGVKANFGYEYTNTQTTSSEFEVSQASREEAQRAYQQQGETSFAPSGSITATFLLKNPTRLAAEVQNLVVEASYVCMPAAQAVDQLCTNPGQLAPLGAAFVPIGPAADSQRLQIGAGGTAEVQLRASDVQSELLRDLVSSPSNLRFSVRSADVYLPGDASTVFSRFRQDVTESTANIVIDNGAGFVGAENVAVNLGREWGRPDPRDGLPTPMTEILDVLRHEHTLMSLGVDNQGHEWQTLETLLGRTTIAITKQTPKGVIDGAWLLFAKAEPDGTAAGGVGEVRRFDEVALNTTEEITLAFVSDRDADGLFSIDETALGTNDRESDTDLDGATADGHASDYFESQIGWFVTLASGLRYKVTSDPTMIDTDRDGISDARERSGNPPTDPRRADTDGDGTADDTDSSPTAPPRGITTKTWTSGQLTSGTGATCNPQFCDLPAGGGFVSTPPARLCGKGQRCEGTDSGTGLYKATFSGTAYIANCHGPCVVGEYIATSGDGVLFYAQKENGEDPRIGPNGPFAGNPVPFRKQIYFEIGSADDLDFVLRYRTRAQNVSVSSISIAPVSESQFVGATGLDDPNFAGIAFDADRLQRTQEQPAVEGPFQFGSNTGQVTKGPGVTLSAGTYHGWNARFRMEVPARVQTRLASVGVVAGESEPPAEEAVTTLPGTGRYSSQDYFDSKEPADGTGRSAIGQGQVFADDFQQSGKASDVSVLFSTRTTLSRLTLPVRSYGQVSGARLHSVTLEPIGNALDIQNAAGQVRYSDGAPVTSRVVAWNGLGLVPAAGSSFAYNQPGDMWAYRRALSTRPGSLDLRDGEIFLQRNAPADGESYAMMPHPSGAAFPVSLDFHRWTIFVRRVEGLDAAKCHSPYTLIFNEPNYAHVDVGDAALRALSYSAKPASTGRLFFSHQTPVGPRVNRAQMNIRNRWCEDDERLIYPSPTHGGSVLYSRVNLTTRPVGGVPPVAG